MNVVADTNVVVSAIFWPGESRACLALWAKRRFHLAVSVSLLEEYSEVAHQVARQFPQVHAEPWLNWIELKAKVYPSALLGKRRSRDPDGDPVLACALGSGSKLVLSKDQDLLVLQKPFGIQIMTPRQFLMRLKAR